MGEYADMHCDSMLFGEGGYFDRVTYNGDSHPEQEDLFRGNGYLTEFDPYLYAKGIENKRILSEYGMDKKIEEESKKYGSKKQWKFVRSLFLKTRNPYLGTCYADMATYITANKKLTEEVVGRE